MSPRAEAPARAWLRRVVLALAALATVATSQPRWRVEATVPAGATGGKAVRVTVEASRAPAVSADQGGRRVELAPEGAPRGAAWAGAGDYVVPAGATLTDVSLSDTCSGGGLCSDCKPPAGTFVRIVRADPVDVWSADARSAPLVARVDAAKRSGVFEVVVESSRRPDVEAVASGPNAARFFAPFVAEQAPPPGAAPTRWIFGVVWTTLEDPPAAPVDLDFQVRASIAGACPAGGACSAPPGESVRIVSVTPR